MAPSKQMASKATAMSMNLMQFAGHRAKAVLSGLEVNMRFRQILCGAAFVAFLMGL